MKNILFAGVLSTMLLISCNDKWDDHYDSGSQEKSTDQVEIVDLTIDQFLSQKPEFSKFYTMLSNVKDVVKNRDNNQDESYPVVDLLKGENSMTVWVADNDAMDAASNRLGTKDAQDFVMKYHVNNLSYPFDALDNGLKIMTLAKSGAQGVYIDVATMPNGAVYLNYDPNLANNVRIVKSYKLKNGYVHLVSDVMEPKVSIYDYISMLPDEFSIIRDSIVKRTFKKFNKGASVPVGVDKTGNTIYDSVFTFDNIYFHANKKDDNKANISLTNKSFTFLLPTNAAISQALADYETGFANLGKTPSQDDIVFFFDWVREAIIFTGTGMFAPANLAANPDVISVTNSRVWRTTVQLSEGNYTAPKTLNNGDVFTIDKMKIPNYELLNRMNIGTYPGDDTRNVYYPASTYKGFFWGRLDDIKYLLDEQKGNWQEQKDNSLPLNALYSWYPYTEGGVVSTYTEGLWTSFQIITAVANPIPYVTFPILVSNVDPVTGSAIGKPTIMKIPAGKYDLSLGGRTSGATPIKVYVNSKPTEGEDKSLTAVKAKVGVAGSNVTLLNTDPKGYGSYFRVKPAGTNNEGASYGTVEVLPETDGSNYGTIEITVEITIAAGNHRIQLWSWALKSTSDNY